MNPLNGLTIVFTGKMSKNRSDIELEAKQLGAFVENRVTRRTDWLVTGARVGRTKTDKAAAVGCQVTTEAEYRAEIQRRKSSLSAAEEQPTEREAPAEAYTNPEWLEKIRSAGGVSF